MTTLESICLLKNGVRSKRVSSFDQSGGNDDFIVIRAGEKTDIVSLRGAGCIRHIWITMRSADPMIRRNAVIRMYWDGETDPSVESPFGDFFGQGWGETYLLNSLPLAAAPERGKALNCYFAMPFSNGARIEIDNQSDQDLQNFYFNIDYEEHDSADPGTGRFHAWWNREVTGVQPPEGETEWAVIAPQGLNPTDESNYLFADLEGRGHFVGIHYYVDNPGPMWYGEGDDMWMVDGEKWPGSLHGTGTEDFFNSAYCPNEIFMHPYFGYARVPNTLGWLGRTHCYRFFLEEPVCFTKSLRASIEHGHDNSLTLDLATVAYWYQAEPHKVFAPMLPRAMRQNMPAIGVNDIHRWRHAFRLSHGGRPDLWGNER